MKLNENTTVAELFAIALKKHADVYRVELQDEGRYLGDVFVVLNQAKTNEIRALFQSLPREEENAS